MLKIGLKFCGGCAPSYDRVALAKRLEAELSGAARFVSWHDDQADMVLVIAGCKNACADVTGIKNRPVHWIRSPEEAPAVISRIFPDTACSSDAG